MTDNTTIARKTARRKLNLLELVNDLGNVSEACRQIGYSREQFYEIRSSLRLAGAPGQGPRTEEPHPSRATEEQEKAVMDYCLEYPTHGALRVSRQFTIPRGSNIGVGAIWVKGQGAFSAGRIW